MTTRVMPRVLLSYLMNILYIAHRIPYPPNKGDKIRSFHQIRHLSKRHSIYLACLVDDRKDLEHIESLKPYCTAIDAVCINPVIATFKSIGMVFGKKPLSVAFFQTEELRQRILRRFKTVKFDRIFIFSSAMAEYVLHVSDIPRIIDFVDVDSEKWRGYAQTRSRIFSWIYQLEAHRLAKYEEHVAREFDHSILVSRAEASLLEPRIKGRPISTVGNGVDLSYFDASMNNVPPPPPVIVFTGTMDYFPNIDAVTYFSEEILPLVRRCFPAVEFHIVGRNPTKAVKALNRHPGVKVTGYVTDVRPYLARAWITVAPFRIARGIQNKVLEALAMGVPVVGTCHAFQGIETTSKNGIRVATDTGHFAREILNLFRDAELRRQYKFLARRYVEAHHPWEHQGMHLESILENL
jgi:sugar transferase (PEP-CTERM/EpsH1 system associated)